MAPRLALLLFVTGILGLFFLDRKQDADSKTSPALWIPVIWLALGSSRMVSFWMGASSRIESPDQYLDGSPMDAAILSVLIAIALGVLIARGHNSSAVLRRNWPIILFLVYCALSTVWSDFPFVAFKRWMKAFGNISMVFIVLTDSNPKMAIKRFLVRAGFVLIPMSILVNKYFPDIGRGYNRWTGMAVFIGVADDKNSLGAICLVFGLASVWCCIDAFREQTGRFRHLLVHFIVVGMAISLLLLANSATSLACFFIGSAIMLTLMMIRTKSAGAVHLVVGIVAAMVLVGYLFSDAYSYSVEALGRETNLTGRTDLWDEFLRMDTSPWLGFGYESFFLGGRLEHLWSKYWFQPREAHNGYLEIYLSLGRVGITLFGLVIIAGYFHIVRDYRRDPRTSALKLAYWCIALFYNVSESAVKVMHPVFIVLLLANCGWPLLAERNAPDGAVAKDS